MGTWGVTPADSFMQQYRAAVQRLLQQRKLSMRQLGEIAWGLAQLQDTDTAAIMTDVLEGAELLLAAPLHVSSSSGTASHAGMADLIWAVAKLQHHPGHAFLASFEAASQRLLETFTPHELAQIVWAFARLAWQPDEPWKELFLQAVQVCGNSTMHTFFPAVLSLLCSAPVMSQLHCDVLVWMLHLLGDTGVRIVAVTCTWQQPCIPGPCVGAFIRRAHQQGLMLPCRSA